MGVEQLRLMSFLSEDSEFLRDAFACCFVCRAVLFLMIDTTVFHSLATCAETEVGFAMAYKAAGGKDWGKGCHD
jgi:hypothetical protein